MSKISMDEDEEAWRYSFTSSTDSLALPNADVQDETIKWKDSLASEIQAKQSNDEDNREWSNSDSARNASASKLKLEAPNEHFGSREDLSVASQSSTASPVEAKEGKKDHLQSLGAGSHTSSLSSLSLQSPFLVKSSPANPHTTREDANSILSKDIGHGVTLNSSANTANSSLLVSPNVSNIAPTEKSTNGINKTQLQNSESRDGPVTHEDSNIDDPSKVDPTPPKIIAYRKSKRTTSEGNFQSILDQSVKVTPKEKFDTKLYVDEKFKDTNYRYATIKRTTEFHQLFRSLDLTDRLLDDFSCALSREILLQGRIYISENNVCFSSNLLGWVTSLIIPQQEIIRIEKKSTAGLFPNGISVETKRAKHNFASFLSRDATYEFMKAVWQGTTGKKMDIIEENPLDKGDKSVEVNEILSTNVSYPDSPEKIESYILSIDGDEASETGESGSEDTSDDAVQVNRNGSTKKKKPETVNTKIMKFKSDSNYTNMGPDLHTPTKVKSDYMKENNETELCNETIRAPIGIVFDILFGSLNTSFHRGFLESHNASEISQYDKFRPMKEDPSKLERSITYRKALGYSIGPKSTRCEVQEIIEKLNFADHIVVLTTTVTPDVPSGSSFSVKTRFCLSWGSYNTTVLKVSYFIKWTSSSWIKSVIEKQTLAGQQESTQDLLTALKAEIDETTYYVEGPSVLKDAMEAEEHLAQEAALQSSEVSDRLKEKLERNSKTFSANKFIKNNIVTVCYFIFSFLVMLLVIQLKVFKVVNEANEIARSQLVVNSYLVSTVQTLANGKSKGTTKFRDRAKVIEKDSNSLWKWVNDKYRKKLNPLEKIEYLTYQLNSLYQEQNNPEGNLVTNIEENLSEIKRQVKDFNYQELLNFDHLRTVVGDLI